MKRPELALIVGASRRHRSVHRVVVHREVHIYQPHLAVIFREHLAQRCFLLAAIWTLVVEYSTIVGRAVAAEMPIGGGCRRALGVRFRRGF